MYVPTCGVCAMGNRPEIYEERVHFWDNVYGYDFTHLKKPSQELLTRHPLIETMHPEHEVALKPQAIHHIDVRTVTLAQLKEWSCEFSFCSTVTARLHGFLVYFDVHFPGVGDIDGKSTKYSCSSSARARKKQRLNEGGAFEASSDSNGGGGESSGASPQSPPADSNSETTKSVCTSSQGTNSDSCLHRTIDTPWTNQMRHPASITLSTAPNAPPTHWCDSVLISSYRVWE